MKADAPKKQRRLGRYGLRPEELRGFDPILRRHEQVFAERRADASALAEYLSRPEVQRCLALGPDDATGGARLDNYARRGLRDLRRRGLI